MKRKILLILIAIWLVVIFIFSNQNIKESKKLSNIFVSNILVEKFGRDTICSVVRKLAHFIIYLIGGIIIYIFFDTFNIETKRKIIYTIIFVMLYACSDELHQKFVDGRGASFIDVIIDTSGSIVGILLYYNIFNKMSRQT